jgi:hypothetical protein
VLGTLLLGGTARKQQHSGEEDGQCTSHGCKSREKVITPNKETEKAHEKGIK